MFKDRILNVSKYFQTNDIFKKYIDNNPETTKTNRNKQDGIKNVASVF